MATVTVDIDDFPLALQKLIEERQDEVRAIALDVATRGAAHAVQITRDAGHVHTGEYTRSFRASAVPEGAELVNASPHAAVLEYGRRPGAPGPPIAPIRDWVRLKLGLRGREMESAAWAIRNSIHRRGSPPRAIMAQTREQMIEWLGDELRDLL